MYILLDSISATDLLVFCHGLGCKRNQFVACLFTYEAINSGKPCIEAPVMLIACYASVKYDTNRMDDMSEGHLAV